jgi:hypothetical protein
LLDVPLFRVAPHDPLPAGVVHLLKDDEKEKGEADSRPSGLRRRRNHRGRRCTLPGDTAHASKRS